MLLSAYAVPGTDILYAIVCRLCAWYCYRLPTLCLVLTYCMLPSVYAVPGTDCMLLPAYARPTQSPVLAYCISLRGTRY
eukprot:3215262-Rhodomonas_salina.1